MDYKTMNTAVRMGAGIVLLLPALLAGCSKGSEDDQSRVIAQQVDEKEIEQRLEGGGMTSTPDTTSLPSTPEFSKVLAFDMSVDKNGAVNLKDARLYYGQAPNQIGNPPMFAAELIDGMGRVIFEIPLWDPRWTFVWSEERNNDFVDLAEAAEIAVIVPFSPSVATVGISKEKERVAALDVTSAVEAFCTRYKEDPDCRGKQAVRQSE
jgi:hypothetical protein